MKQGIGAVRGLKYKLRMMGIPISGPSYIYGDSMPMLHDTFKPESVIRKKIISVCFHTVCESVAMSKSLAGHIPNKKNVADPMTNVIYGQRQKYLVSNIPYDIYDDG